MPEERRSFLRMPVRLKALARKLADPEELSLFHAAPGSSHYIELSSSGLSDPVLAQLAVINSKLDQLIGRQELEALNEDFPIRLETLDLSGSGVRIRLTPDIDIGDYLEVVVILSHFPLTLAGATGQVTRCEAVEGSSNTCDLAVDFTRIRERDQEAILQHVFQLQRDQRRELKF